MQSFTQFGQKQSIATIFDLDLDVCIDIFTGKLLLCLLHHQLGLEYISSVQELLLPAGDLLLPGGDLLLPGGDLPPCLPLSARVRGAVGG